VGVDAAGDQAAGRHNQAAWDCVGTCAHTDSSTHKVGNTSSNSSKRCVRADAITLCESARRVIRLLGVTTRRRGTVLAPAQKVTYKK
jgi:hypothetical protein